jgi:hypothetical protein
MSLYYGRLDEAHGAPSHVVERPRVLFDVLVVVTLEAKRERVLEVKMRRIAGEIEAVTGSRPRLVKVSGGGRTAIFRASSWAAPDILMRLLRARLEQETLNGGMFHFSNSGEPCDSVMALEATGIATF